MGYHADVYKGISDLLIAEMPRDFPVVNALRIDEIEFANMAMGVCILRESIDYEPHPEINPDTEVTDQAERWEWALYVKGGGGAARPTESGAVVDLYLETIQKALNAQRPTDDCGPLQLVSEDFEGRDGATVTYTQRWTHRRLKG